MIYLKSGKVIEGKVLPGKRNILTHHISGKSFNEEYVYIDEDDGPRTLRPFLDNPLYLKNFC